HDRSPRMVTAALEGVSSPAGRRSGRREAHLARRATAGGGWRGLRGRIRGELRSGGLHRGRATVWIPARGGLLLRGPAGHEAPSLRGGGGVRRPLCARLLRGYGLLLRGSPARVPRLLPAGERHRASRGRKRRDGSGERGQAVSAAEPGEVREEVESRTRIAADTSEPIRLCVVARSCGARAMTAIGGGSARPRRALVCAVLPGYDRHSGSRRLFH